MARLYKCPECDDKDIEDNMVIDYIGKQKKRFHPKCHKRFLAEAEFKRVEKKEMDELVETIKDIHDIKLIPNQFYSFLQDIRNGNELFGNVGTKKSKQGYSYAHIAKAYESNIDQINWAMNNRQFKNDLVMLKYSLAIIKSNIDQVSKHLEEKQEREDRFERSEVDQDIGHGISDDIKYKEIDDEMDISKFL
ncbi:hypothetical protein JOC34_000609 [Virgibacillus halotolerans]|uniref:hypothetical protein n=1 Tax=Virgibacillus halotolerans TaxID=1071053 RepID=UPI00195F8BDD|nr:hypothetical protein [Virgibacillus halotolerans]MBM7598252.1 hypothetical protein [Virgibacillus halotolerans]